MKLTEAKEKFIAAWGNLGTEWGINRAMAQIHALLLITPEDLSAEEIMDDLNISRGNANQNIRALIDWRLVERIYKPGERKEYFSAEKDIWKVFKQVVKERRKRELEPTIQVLKELSKVEGDKREKNLAAFTKTIDGILNLAIKADHTLETMIKADEHWFIGTFMKMMR